MALLITKLESELSKIIDRQNSEYKGDGEIPEFAVNLSTAFSEYAKVVTPPSTTTEQARLAMQALLNTISPAANETTNITIYVNSYVQYCTILAAGMTTPALTGNPPIGSPQIEYLLELKTFERKSNAQIVEDLAFELDLWIKTGTSTNTISSVTTPWQ